MKYQTVSIRKVHQHVTLTSADVRDLKIDAAAVSKAVSNYIMIYEQTTNIYRFESDQMTFIHAMREIARRWKNNNSTNKC